MACPVKTLKLLSTEQTCAIQGIGGSYLGVEFVYEALRRPAADLNVPIGEKRTGEFVMFLHGQGFQNWRVV